MVCLGHVRIVSRGDRYSGATGGAVLNGLAVCSGIGGLELGIKLACPSLRTVAYVEREAYAAVVLATRMEEGRLDKAPIWSDITTFDGLPWRGLVDIVSSGFPCQPFSLAGKRLKEKDPRHLWPHIARIIGECEPRYVFLENVHISAFRQPFDDLRAMGFVLAPPYVCTAAEMGAGHIRRRVFVLAHSPRVQRDRKIARPDGSRAEVEISRNTPEQPGRAGNKAQERQAAGSEITGAAWWSSEPGLERLVHGVPNRVDRDRTLGNAVVPIMAAKAFVELMRQI